MLSALRREDERRCGMKDKIETIALVLAFCAFFGVFAWMSTVPELRENFRKMYGTNHRCECACCQVEGGE
jgi:hypothetical protein